MKIAVLSANLGSFDKQPKLLEQTIPFEFFNYTDENFPPRQCMNPRFQSKIVRMFSWEWHMGFDYYIWMDSAQNFKRPDSIQWLVEQCGQNEIAFFKHPKRDTPLQEKEYLESHMHLPYIEHRYKNEWYNEEWFSASIPLIETGVFIHRGSSLVKSLMFQWFFEVARYNMNDQLSLPMAIEKSGIPYTLITEKMDHGPYIKHYGHPTEAL